MAFRHDVVTKFSIIMLLLHLTSIQSWDHVICPVCYWEDPSNSLNCIPIPNCQPCTYCNVDDDGPSCDPTYGTCPSCSRCNPQQICDAIPFCQACQVCSTLDPTCRPEAVCPVCNYCDDNYECAVNWTCRALLFNDNDYYYSEWFTDN